MPDTAPILVEMEKVAVNLRKAQSNEELFERANPRTESGMLVRANSKRILELIVFNTSFDLATFRQAVDGYKDAILRSRGVGIAPEQRADALHFAEVLAHSDARYQSLSRDVGALP